MKNTSASKEYSADSNLFDDLSAQN